MPGKLWMLLSVGLCSTLIACAPPEQVPDVPQTSVTAEPSGTPCESDSQQKILTMAIGDKEFQIILCDNSTSQVLRERLPLTITMEALNGNEKFHHFSDTLPTSEEAVGSISAGDVMLYQNDCLVLLYESHDTNYLYTPIGRLKETGGLAEAVGSGKVELTLDK